jgi:hypothetical protein
VKTLKHEKPKKIKLCKETKPLNYKDNKYNSNIIKMPINKIRNSSST